MNIHIHQNYLSLLGKRDPMKHALEKHMESNEMLMWVSCSPSKQYTRQLIVLKVP